MNLKDLTYFKHLAESLSFTTTAKHFYISQPSISLALKRLEDELDTVLIDRKRIHKNLSLTETGEILLKHSKKILKSIDEVTEEIHDFKHQIVYFGFLPTIGGHFMTQLMPFLTKFASSMKLIEEESSDVMLDLVRSSQVPISIIGSDVELIPEEDIIQVPLTQETLALWVSKTNALADESYLTAADIQDQLFISLEQGYTHQRIFEKWVTDNRLKAPQTLYTKEIQTALAIASSTDMVAFMSDILVKDRSKLVRVPIENGPKFYLSLIINRKLHHLNNYQSEFNSVLLELATDFSQGNLDL